MSRPAVQGPSGHVFNGGVQPRFVPVASTRQQLLAMEAAATQMPSSDAAKSAGDPLLASFPVSLTGLNESEVIAHLTSIAVEMTAEGESSWVQSVSQPVPFAGVVNADQNLLPPSISAASITASFLNTPQAHRAPGRPLRVAHVGPYLLQGGAERWLLDLVRHVNPDSLRFTRSICTNPATIDASYVSELSGAGVVLEAGDADSVREAAAEADVLLSWGVSLDEFLGDVRPPLSVQVVHGDGPFNRLLLSGSRRSIDHCVAVSHTVRSRISPDLPTSVIYNGVDAARLARRLPEGQLRRQLGLEPDDFVVGYVGRFSREKRVSVVLDAVARLPERFKAVLVGWGPLLGTLREQAERDLPGRCIIASVRDELGDVYRMMDAVCLMSDQEGFPLVMLEAMLCGRPFVSTPVGGVAEIIEDRVNGLITDGTAEHLAERLKLLADNPRWAAGIAAEGAACVEQFGYAHRMARDYEQLLHHLWNLRQAA